MTRQQLPATGDIQVATDGQMPAGTADYTRDKIRALIHLAPGPVLSARARVTRHGDPAVPHPVVAQANLDVNGRVVRAEADGETAVAAVDRLEARLRSRLERMSENWEARRGSAPSHEPHEWRHQSERPRHHRWYPRPEDEREIVRRKSFTLHRCTIDDAARDMGLLDYEFHLFIEAATGQDTVLYRAGETGYRVAQVTPPEPHQLATFRLPVTISPHPAARLTTSEAVNRLNLLALPFLFFVADLDRGAVLYHRYDGHYGLISPAD